ncbi:hypothetical protein MLP_17440 [Microlunatus phosphovorus NM-1]|uniref:DUF222 domain-containing protein n=2 Tax=Microlunatus phosphovorus TaxID=29405 RepID=F5XS77_MICPN|nr:hypothetical protein MLP_17440 [Microlunatus phosphovorus NM-1]
MFEDRLEESLGNPRALLNLAADTMLTERTAGCRKLLIAAAWADCHSAPADLELVDGEPVQDLCEERFVRLGGAATPLVAEFSPSELGHSLQTSLGAARRLVACALTIRHRLPRLWDRVTAGDVWAWKAMQYADKTRHLGGLSSWLVDLKITRHVETMAWPRFLDLLDATLLEVDEATYQQRADEAAGHKDVRTYRGEHGLRTLIAKIEAGDALAFQALVDRVAECLADEGDDDPIGARRAKAVGIIAHQARLRDLLARHADQPHDPRHPEDRVNTHLDNPTDPWAEDDLPPAGWETSRHGNYHQPSFDDLDDSRNAQTPDSGDPAPDDQEEAPISEADRTWHEQQRDDADNAHGDHREATGRNNDQQQRDGAHGGASDNDGSDEDLRDDDQQRPDSASDDDHAGAADHNETSRTSTNPSASSLIPAAFDRAAARDHDGRAGHCCGCACGSTFDLRPMTSAELNANRTRAVVHVHVSDQTLINHHGVLRTADGPITLEQFRRWLTDSDANITIRPVLDPADVAAVDNYEIPTTIREAVQARHPGSVYPYSPATEITTGGRLDLDHSIPYQKNGPPGQTRVGNLGPLTRSEHRTKTLGGWQTHQPDPGTHLWRSPHGWISLVTNQGTLLLGDNPFAQQVWQASQPAAAVSR